MISLILLTACSTLCVASAREGTALSPGCEGGLVKKSFRVFVESRRNQSGAWETTFDANHDLPNASKAVTFDLKHTVLDCGGRKTLEISGAFFDSSNGNSTHGLRFHERCGTNIAITNEGRTVQKLNAEDRINAVALTNRPLRANEMFEVRLDKKVNKDGFFMGIGLTSLSPDRDPIPSHLNSLKIGTWMYYHNHIFNNGTLLVKAYTRSLDQTQVGERIGVMRSDFGTLHFFHNGVDLGPAASNLPPNLHGGLELYGDSAQMTIVS